MRRIAAAVGMALAAAAAARSAPPEDRVYLFFATDTPDLAKVLLEARAQAGPALRPVFLLDRSESEPPDAFMEAVGASGLEFPVIDEEGLELARRFGVRATPCAVRTGRRTHVAVGSKIDWKELMSCE